MITKNILRQIAPTAKESIISDLEKYFDKYIVQYEVNTYLRVCHFLAQAAHESASFRTLEEYATGSAYEGRRDLGNTKTGDGKRYKGRGIFQLTGRSNYRTYGQKLGLDLEGNPELAEQPETSVRTALEYWKTNKLNAYADKDDIGTITKRINGGFNGLEDRKANLARAKKVLKDIIFTDKPTPAAPAAEHLNIVVAKKGDNSSYVNDLQKMLVGKGIKLDVDGDFGPQTEEGVKEFQRWAVLPATGQIDTRTLAELMKQ